MSVPVHRVYPGLGAPEGVTVVEWGLRVKFVQFGHCRGDIRCAALQGQLVDGAVAGYSGCRVMWIPGRGDGLWVAR